MSTSEPSLDILSIVMASGYVVLSSLSLEDILNASKFFPYFRVSA